MDRSPPFTTAAIQELISRVRVESSPELERYYPGRWPARVEIRWKGRALSRGLRELDASRSWPFPELRETLTVPG